MLLTRWIAACAVVGALGLGAAACGGDDESGGLDPNVTPGITVTGNETAVGPIVTPFPTPVISGRVVDSTASKGYAAEFPEGWTFYPNRIQTRDASVDVSFAPMAPGAGAQASIAVECIVNDDPQTEAHVSFEATKVARIGTNTNIRVSQREIDGVTATVLDYRFESSSDSTIPPLEKQDVLFSSGSCDWKITTSTPEGERAQYEGAFAAFLASFQLAD